MNDREIPRRQRRTTAQLAAALLVVLFTFQATAGPAAACSQLNDDVWSVAELIEDLERDRAVTVWKAEVVATVEPLEWIFEDWTRESVEVPVAIWGDVIPVPRVTETRNNRLRRHDDCYFRSSGGPALGSLTYYVDELEVRLPLYGGFDSETDEQIPDLEDAGELEAMLTERLGQPQIIEPNPELEVALIDGVTVRRLKDPRAIAGRVVLPAVVLISILGLGRRLNQRRGASG